ncbi:putative ribonuclease H-like domain-containing protein [Tanacetum coccineum]
MSINLQSLLILLIKVYKVIKALYGLHQAPKAWYETLSSFLMENGFRRGTIDKTLFIKKNKSDIMLVQVYVDDIIFGSTKKSMCTEFEDRMHKRFQMSSMGELTFFLGLQVKQQPDGIFLSQDMYVADILKKFDFWSIRTATIPIESNKPLVTDEDGEDVDVHVYRSMIGSLMYLTVSRPDIMFAVCACARFQDQAYRNFDFILFDIALWKRPDDISYQGNTQDSNVTDLLTKGFDVTRFNFLVVSIGMLNLNFVLLVPELIPLGLLSTTRRYLQMIMVFELRAKLSLESCPKHNMVAYLEKTDGNAEFHEIIDFLTSSSIHYAPTVSPVVSTTFVEQFWMTAKSTTINNVRYTTATVAGKPVLILEGKQNFGNVTPLFPSMLAQPTEDEGAVSERPSETQPTPSPTHPSEDQSEPQPDPFLIPSSSNPIPDSIPEGSGGNHGECLHEEKIGKEEVFEDKVDAEGVVIKKQGRSGETCKLKPTTEDAHDEGIVKDSEETRVSTKDQVSTDKPNEGTAKPNEGTAEPNEGTAEPKDGNSDESQKGFEIKEIKDTDRPRTTTERSILTLKPLPKIDPKDKGKKVLEEKKDEEIARKVSGGTGNEEEGGRRSWLEEDSSPKAAFTKEYDLLFKLDYMQTRFLQRSFKKKKRKVHLLCNKRDSFIYDTIGAQRRFLAQQRSKAIRNKLPIRNQLRNQK